MSHLLEIYRAQIKTTAVVQLQYRVAMVIWLIGTVLEPVMYLVVWSTVAVANGGSAGGFTVAEFAAYYLAIMVVNHLTFMWHMWEYDFRIREGLLSPLLLRPLHPIHSDIAENISYKLITSVVMIPTFIILTFVFQPEWDPPLWALLASVPAILLAFGIRFMSGWALAMTAF